MLRHSFAFLSLGLGLIGPAGVAQDCRLSVMSTDHVIWPGESENLNVWAHFPLDAYAFASADFDVRAETPQWTYASDGVIVGGEVLGISVGQQHDPFNGHYADPSNPYRVWAGVFEPDSYEPRLIEVQALPSSFFYYPSEFTASSVECEAAPGHEWLFINPLAVGDAHVAPAEGTTIRTGIGRGMMIVEPANGVGPVRFGILSDNGKPVGIRPLGEMDDLTIEIGVEEQNTVAMEMLTLSAERVDFGYEVFPNWPHADLYKYVLKGPDGRIREYEFAGYDEIGRLATIVDPPDAYNRWIEYDRENERAHVVIELQFYFPTRIRMSDDYVQEVETVEVHACRNNLRQLALAAHNHIESGHSNGVQVALGDGSVRFLQPQR